MTRVEAISNIEALYGFEHESTQKAIAHLGAMAFSDEALSLIADIQIDQNLRWHSAWSGPNDCRKNLKPQGI